MGIHPDWPSSVHPIASAPERSPRSPEKQVLPPRFTEWGAEAQNVASGYTAKKLGGCYWNSLFPTPKSYILNMGESAWPAQKPEEKSFRSKAPGISVVFPRFKHPFCNK